MFVHERTLSRALRTFVVLVVLAIAAALLPTALIASAQAAPLPKGAPSDPAGNNGTVKIVEDGDFDSIPNNDPHVGCTFTIEWYGFDEGDDIISKVTFEMQSPTGSVGLTVDGPPTVFVGGDDASGAGTSTGLDGRQAYTLRFDGEPPPIQGYHLKLTIETPGSQGNDNKYKVFWVEGCDPVEPPAPDVDLVVDKSSDISIAGPGDRVTYTVNVRNQGQGDADDVIVTDTLPQGTTYVSSSAPCTYASGVVTCNLGTIAAGGDRSVTITVKVNASANSGGKSQHQHQLDVTKVESHVSSFGGSTTGTTQCPSGYVATDGSVRLDHVDQGAGGFEDVEVVTSAVTSDGRGWTGTIRNHTTGQVQAKVMVVCASDRTVSGEDHSHPLVITGPSTSAQTFGPGRHTVDLNCAAGSYPIRPSHVLTAGSAVVGTHRTSGGWQFIVDVDTAATGTFGIHCLATALGTASGHSHDLVFAELTQAVTVPAGATVEKKLTCADGFKGIVAWADIDPGLVSLGNDPQPITRVFKFYNPTSGPLSARFGLLCLAIRAQGEDHPGDSRVTNTASAATSSNDANTGNNSGSATIRVSPTGVIAASRARVVSRAGRTVVRLGLATGSSRPVTLKLVSARKVAGLKAGTVLARKKAGLKAGSGSVRLVAKGARAKALRSGKVGKAKLVMVSRGTKEVQTIRLR